MTFTEIRNTLTEAISKAVGVPVILSDQVSPEAAVPFIIYSVTTPYAPTGEQGDYSLDYNRDEVGEVTSVTNRRREQPSATFSFTACSENRWVGEEGQETYIHGEDEAHDIADRAIGFLLHGGYQELATEGIVIVEVTNAGNRTTLVIDEAARRYGFDARIRYTRDDTRTDGIVLHVNTIQKRSEQQNA